MGWFKWFFRDKVLDTYSASATVYAKMHIKLGENTVRYTNPWTGEEVPPGPGGKTPVVREAGLVAYCDDTLVDRYRYVKALHKHSAYMPDDVSMYTWLGKAEDWESGKLPEKTSDKEA